MFKFCDKCNTRVGFREKFKMWNNGTYKGYVCENCNTKYKPTKLSLLVDFVIMLIMYMLVFMNKLYIKIGYIQCFILLIVSTFIVPIIVIRYKAIE
ncbi:hypothetical protein [Romboutsia hominis]|uniref:hypothetical protein n=1 Tax=Romboutsia hominis TaxID=1507512 RepID=UPI001F06A96A|nr:hypothetical protein [Romboutsia hominis]MCH1960057.1 hypothetical protein [Romboutsia hominis]MCH1969514.1 hypothetical protein [Romboutsia hominis]